MEETKNNHQQVQGMMEIVRQNIKTTRHTLHLNQDQVATRMGIDLKTFANYEQGVTDIPLSRLFEITLALNTDAALLVTDKDSLLHQVFLLLPQLHALVIEKEKQK